MGREQTRLVNDQSSESKTGSSPLTEGEWLPDGGDTDPKALANRLRRAAELDATIVPVAPGMYHLTSESGETYVLDLDGYAHGKERGVCECRDYRYRTGPKGIDCKHIIAVKQQVRAGLLPPPEADPVDWLHERLDEIEAVLCATDVDDIEKEIEQMRHNPYRIEYRELANSVKDRLRTDGKPTGDFTLRY